MNHFQLFPEKKQKNLHLGSPLKCAQTPGQRMLMHHGLATVHSSTGNCGAPLGTMATPSSRQGINPLFLSLYSTMYNAHGVACTYIACRIRTLGEISDSLYEL